MSELCRLRRSEGYEVCDDAEAEVCKSPRPAAATLLPSLRHPFPKRIQRPILQQLRPAFA